MVNLSGHRPYHDHSPAHRDRLLDNRFHESEGEHLMWGLGFHASLILGAISLLAWRR